MSRAREFADLAGAADAGGLTGRNLIINGDFKIWQRATSSTAANYSGPDRWYYGNAGTYARSTDVPSGQGFQYSNSVKVTAATTYGVTAQRIEAVNCKHLVGKSVTASFWLKTISGSTSMNCVLYRANTEDGHSSGVTAIETKPFTGVTNTWTYYTLTWNTLPAETANGLQLYFYSTDAGTDPEYRITGVQLEVGEQATPFEHRSYGDELRRCQRYFFKSYPTDRYAGYNTANSVREGACITRNQDGSARSANAWPFHYPVTMRTQPTITSYSLNGTSGSASKLDGNLDHSSNVTNNGYYETAHQNGWQIVEASLDGLGFGGFHVYSDAEL